MNYTERKTAKIKLLERLWRVKELEKTENVNLENKRQEIIKELIQLSQQIIDDEINNPELGLTYMSNDQYDALTKQRDMLIEIEKRLGLNY